MQSAMEDMKKISLKEFEILNTSSPGYPGNKEPGTNGAQTWSVKEFEKRLKVDIIQKTGMDLEFDLIGVDASLSNAFRRLMLSEVPSMAIEKIYMYNNTSIVQDEVLSHRLGLIPLMADPRLFEYKSDDTDDFGTEKDTLEYELKVRCKRRPNAPKDSKDQADLYIDHKVFTKSMKWIPKGSQSSQLTKAGPVHDDILIAKMRPGHEMDIKMYAYKGVGSDHAKFSPVSTAFYRLLPQVVLKREVTGEAAERLQSCFSPGVIKLEGKKKKAVVDNARYDGCSRNVYRHDDLRDAVDMHKVRDHFIFTVESVGAMEPEDIFVQSIEALVDKCDFFLKELDQNIKEA